MSFTKLRFMAGMLLQILVSKANRQRHNLVYGAYNLDHWATERVLWSDKLSFNLTSSSRQVQQIFSTQITVANFYAQRGSVILWVVILWKSCWAWYYGQGIGDYILCKLTFMVFWCMVHYFKCVPTYNSTNTTLYYINKFWFFQILAWGNFVVTLLLIQLHE